jgi:hypothetical protein
MAIIKSDNSTDQLRVDPVSKAAHVTLYNPDGTVASLVTLSLSAVQLAVLAQESGGNLQKLAQDGEHEGDPLLRAILMELRIMNSLNIQIALGQGLGPPDLDKEYRKDSYYSSIAANNRES